MPAPTLDDDLSLAERIEYLTVQEFVSEPGVETLDVSVLPRTSRRDVRRLRADRRDPHLHRFGDELRAVVGTNVSRHAALNEKLGENIDDVDRFQLAPDPDRQALTRELIDHVEHPVFPSIMRAIFDEVVGPHVIAALRPQADTRTIRQPQTPAFRLLVRDLQPLAPPDPLNPLVIHQPARMAQQRGDLAIAVAAVLTGQFNDIGGQALFVISPRRRLALRRAMLSERRTGAALGDVKLTSDMLDTNATARGA
jgi:hypothetical protein